MAIDVRLERKHIHGAYKINSFFSIHGDRSVEPLRIDEEDERRTRYTPEMISEMGIDAWDNALFLKLISGPPSASGLI